MQIAQQEVALLFSKYAIPYARSQLVDPIHISHEIPYPVVVKVADEFILHKTDVGGVMTNIPSPSALSNAIETIRSSVFSHTKRYPTQFLVQEQLSGTEFIVGAKRSETFGFVTLVGLGGIYVEVFADTAVRVGSLTQEDAYAMIDELKAKKLFEGVRGQKALCKSALAHVIVQISRLMAKENMSELDCNPVLVTDSTAIVADGRLIRG